LQPGCRTGQSERVREVWKLQGDDAGLDGRTAAELVVARLERDVRTTWFESDRGRIACLVTNRERALLMVLDHVEDAGEHLVDEASDEVESTGYVLENGQVDDYADRDTVPLASALAALREVIDADPAVAARPWVSDR
jgi:hypothetical protein